MIIVLNVFRRLLSKFICYDEKYFGKEFQEYFLLDSFREKSSYKD